MHSHHRCPQRARDAYGLAFAKVISCPQSSLERGRAFFDAEVLAELFDRGIIPGNATPEQREVAERAVSVEHPCLAQRLGNGRQ